MDKPNVLFLCTGNSARSQMAEAFLRRYAGDRLNVFSAGLEPKGIHPLTEQVMAEIGMPLQGQRSKSVSEYLGKYVFSHVIIVCRQAEGACPRVFPGALQRLAWSFEDPAAAEGTDEEKMQKFREVRDQIGQKIREWLPAEGLPVENPAS